MKDMQMCLDNADNCLKAQKCTNREFFAGKCAGIEEIMSIKEAYL